MTTVFGSRTGYAAKALPFMGRSSAHGAISASAVNPVDKRHIAKVIQYGHVVPLDDWKQVLQDVD